MKTSAQVVIIGGGVVGCSVLYHLTKLGWSDVMLLERSELTSGSTWHAAGGFHTLNGDTNMAALQGYTIRLYKELEEITGLSCGLHHVGGVTLADNQDRMDMLLAERAKPKRRSAAFTVEPVVMINNELSDKFTVIEMEALDRPGLLSDVTDALADLSVNIASAHIATFGEKVIDTFYATDLVGFKITSPQKLAAIKRKLMAALGGTAEEGPKAPTKRQTTTKKSGKKSIA